MMDDNLLENVFALAARLTQAGRYDDATALFEGLLSITNNADAWFGLGVIATKTGGDAVLYLRHANAAAPEDVNIMMSLAEALVTAGTPQAAAPILERLGTTRYAARARAITSSRSGK